MSKLDFLNFEVKAVPEEEGVFEGYASTWERDLIDDEITKGAYAETLSADYPDGGAGIPLYWGHNYDSPLNCIGESLSHLAVAVKTVTVAGLRSSLYSTRTMPPSGSMP